MGGRAPNSTSGRGPLDRIRILIAGGDRRFTDSLASSVTNGDSVEVVDAGTDAAVAVERASALAPEVVLLEVDTLGAEGIEAARRIEQLDRAPLLVLLAQPSSPTLRRAAEAVHADAYVATGHAAEVLRIVLGLVAASRR